jgi:hypothetical protein
MIAGAGVPDAVFLQVPEECRFKFEGGERGLRQIDLSGESDTIVMLAIARQILSANGDSASPAVAVRRKITGGKKP